MASIYRWYTALSNALLNPFCLWVKGRIPSLEKMFTGWQNSRVDLWETYVPMLISISSISIPHLARHTHAVDMTVIKVLNGGLHWFLKHECHGRWDFVFIVSEDLERKNVKSQELFATNLISDRGSSVILISSKNVKSICWPCNFSQILRIIATNDQISSSIQLRTPLRYQLNTEFMKVHLGEEWSSFGILSMVHQVIYNQRYRKRRMEGF